jgi:hypothetical protein
MNLGPGRLRYLNSRLVGLVKAHDGANVQAAEPGVNADVVREIDVLTGVREPGH